MPTKNRARYIPSAIRSYQSQTYPNRELIILDNGQDMTEELIPSYSEDPSIVYAQVDGDLTTGAMRNLCAEWSRGEFICHFDDDDWSAPTRVDDQVRRLGFMGMLTGYSTMYFYDERDHKCYLWSRETRFALGTSLCYRRLWWENHPFKPMRIGEDAVFFQEAERLVPGQVSMTPVGKMMVARIHDQQTSVKRLCTPRYHPIPPEQLPQQFVQLIATG